MLLVEAFIARDTLFSMARNRGDKPSEYNAWKFLKSFRSGYIKYQTYVDPIACTHFLRIALNATDQSGLYQVSFKDLADNTTKTITLRFHKQTTPDEYAVYNAVSKRDYCQGSGGGLFNAFRQAGKENIDELKHKDEQELYNSTVAYSDYSKCSIIQDSETPTHCKMFVNSGTSKHVIRQCAKKFPGTCDSSRYDESDPSICG